jgi:hypothetical protein
VDDEQDEANQSAADAMAAALTAIAPPPLAEEPQPNDDEASGQTFLDGGEIMKVDDLPTLPAPRGEVSLRGSSPWTRSF